MQNDITQVEDKVLTALEHKWEIQSVTELRRFTNI